MSHSIKELKALAASRGYTITVPSPDHLDRQVANRERPHKLALIPQDAPGMTQSPAYFYSSAAAARFLKVGYLAGSTPTQRTAKHQVNHRFVSGYAEQRGYTLRRYGDGEQKWSLSLGGDVHYFKNLRKARDWLDRVPPRKLAKKSPTPKVAAPYVEPPHFDIKAFGSLEKALGGE